MSLPRAFFLAFAGLAYSASAQPACDLGDCEDSAFLQRDVFAKSLAFVPAAGDNSDVIKKLEFLEGKTKAAGAAAHRAQTLEFGKNVASTIDCLKNTSTCSTPKLAEGFLEMLASGLAMAAVLPEVGLFAGLGAIALNMFFPPGKDKEAGPPALTLKEITAAVSNQLENFDEVQVTNFYFPAFLDSIQSMITQVGAILGSQDGSDTSKVDWSEFQKEMPTFTAELGGLVKEVNTKWNDVVNAGGYIQTQIASLETFSSSCTSTCPLDPNVHWASTACDTDLITAESNVKTFKEVAGKLTSISNTMALLPCMVQGVYTKYGQEQDLYLTQFADVVTPLIKTALKVNQALLQLDTACSATFAQYATSAGTNMPSLRSTDRDHSLCSDTSWYGQGWYSVTSVSFCQYDCDGGGNDWTLTMKGAHKDSSWYGWRKGSKRDWWVGECTQNLQQVPGFAGDEGSMCSNIWNQGGYDDDWWSKSIHGNEYWFCARPDACAPSACSTLLTSSGESFGWQEE